MLEKLLQRLSKGGPISTASLSVELNASPELVELMLADLVRKGYLRATGGACETPACQGCSLGSTCSPKARIWELTSKAPRNDIGG